MTYRHAFAALVVAAGCESGKPAPKAPDPLRDDFERICNAYTLSGADLDQTAQRTYILATWLDANVTSDAGRAFLVEFAQLGEDRAARRAKLDETRRRVGLASCPLIAHWEG